MSYCFTLLCLPMKGQKHRQTELKQLKIVFLTTFLSDFIRCRAIMKFKLVTLQLYISFFRCFGDDFKVD